MENDVALVSVSPSKRVNRNRKDAGSTPAESATSPGVAQLVVQRFYKP